MSQELPGGAIGAGLTWGDLENWHSYRVEDAADAMDRLIVDLLQVSGDLAGPPITGQGKAMEAADANRHQLQGTLVRTFELMITTKFALGMLAVDVAEIKGEVDFIKRRAAELLVDISPDGIVTDIAPPSMRIDPIHEAFRQNSVYQVRDAATKVLERAHKANDDLLERLEMGGVIGPIDVGRG